MADHADFDLSHVMGLEKWMQAVDAKPRVDELVEGLVPATTGFVLLGGRTGLGKTNLLLQLAFSIAAGRSFYGHKTRQAKVGYLLFEGDQHQTQDRLRKLVREFPEGVDNFNFNLLPPRKLTRHPPLLTMAWYIEFFSGVDLMCMDPLKYMVPGDYTKSEVAQSFIVDVQHLSREVGAPAILSHHIRKPNKDPRSPLDPGDLYEIKGATDYVDAATTVMFLERERQGRNESNTGFGRVNPDNMVLHFPKTRDAVASEDPVFLSFNRRKLLFEPRDIFDLQVREKLRALPE